MTSSSLQREVGEHIGVEGTTITTWELNATAPAIRYIPTIIEFLGYDPLPTTNSFTECLAAARRVFGLSQRKMAEKLGVDPATLQGWEAGRHQPTGKNLEVIKELLPIRQRW